MLDNLGADGCRLPVEGSRPGVLGVFCTLGWPLVSALGQLLSWATWLSGDGEVLAGLICEIPLLSPKSAFLWPSGLGLLGCEVAIPVPKSDAAGSVASTSSVILIPKINP